MTDRTERRVTFWGTLLAAIVAGGSLGAALVRPVVAAEVKPVSTEVQALDKRVTRLEAQREEDVKRLEEMRSDIKEILRNVK